MLLVSLTTQKYLATHPNTGFLAKLTLSNLGLTSVGLGSLVTEALPKCTGIAYLNISGNKLAYGTDVSDSHHPLSHPLILLKYLFIC